MEESFKFCSACGQQNNLSAQFCQRCGARYTGATPPVAPQRSRHPYLRILLLLVVAFFGCAIFGRILMGRRGNTTPSPQTAETLNAPTPALASRPANSLATPMPIAADTGLADSLADNLAIVFAEAASRDATGITAKGGTEIHVHIHDMKDFEFRRLQAGTLAGIRLWMKKHSAELSQTKVQKICVNNGPLMGLSVCEAR